MTQMTNCWNGHLMWNICLVNRKRNYVSRIVVKMIWTVVLDNMPLLTRASWIGLFWFVLKVTMFLAAITWGGFTLRSRFKKLGYQNTLLWTLTFLLYIIYSNHHIVGCMWRLVIAAYLAKFPYVQTESPNHAFASQFNKSWHVLVEASRAFIIIKMSS